MTRKPLKKPAAGEATGQSHVVGDAQEDDQMLLGMPRSAPYLPHGTTA